ncbi:MAG: arginine--tRNA ligase [Acidobacteriia bacterium]|nr:arginine--tRNA ligase [Terriglobia bacterium]
MQRRIQQRFVNVIREAYGLEVTPPPLNDPPSGDLGDLSLASCFELAKQLRRSPKKIAEELAMRIPPLAGIERVSVAGAGYLNFHLDRAAAAAQLFALRTAPPVPGAAGSGKIVVEHTSINPNKAAHIGHLRNAVLGDTFARLLRASGEEVEVQNYIDNTGVQVADVVVGFVHLEKKTLSDVEKLIQDSAVRFDYSCWDLYARVFQFYEEKPEALSLRSQALKDIEEGHGDLAALADLISTAIVRLHLATMLRINVEYDLLVQESEILRLDFWKSAFELLKSTGAIRYEDSGKNQGCWVMTLREAEEGKTEEAAGGEDVKIIVRSNGTVTYVGKDIAYHLWKFALLGKDFGYQLFHTYPGGHQVWRTALEGEPAAPPCGRAHAAYAVIDTRQSYLQNVVKAALDALGFHEQSANLHHFAYEVVGLSPGCAEELGVELTAEDRARPYVEVSGRKGQGVKADDLLDRLLAKALEEVRSRQITQDPQEQETCARRIAVGALRYFLLKVSRRVIIAFDFKEALAFEGETGPYLQYTSVRARNIFRKFQETHPEFQPADLDFDLSMEQLRKLYSGEDGLAFWQLSLLAAQLEMAAQQAIATQEPSIVAKYAFRIAQAFNNFYHRYHILSEADPGRQAFLLFLVHIVERTLAQALDQMGIEIPEHM